MSTLRHSGIIQVIPPLDRIRFTLDPLAQYLAALQMVDELGDQEELWSIMLRRANTNGGVSGSINEFFLAVWDCCTARTTEPKPPYFVLEELAKRIDIDTKVIEKIQNEQYIGRLLDDLLLPETKKRKAAAEVLGRIGLDAKATVSALSTALQDTDDGVRLTAAQALGRIGPHSSSAPLGVRRLLEPCTR